MNKKASYDNKLQEAKSLLNRGMHQEALEIFEDLRKEYPEKPGPIVGAGACLYAIEERTQALGCFIEASKLDPENAENYVNMGHCLKALDQERVAITQYEKALALDNNNFQALSALGALYYERGRTIEAIDAIKKAVAIKPSNSDNQALLGLALASMGNQEDALKHANKAIRLAPNNANLYFTMGSIHLLFGDQTEADKFYNKAIDIDPYNANTYIALTTKKITVKDQPIINKMEKALKKGMPSIDRQALLYALGKAYNDLKKTDKAFEYIHKANELTNPEFDANNNSRKLRKQKKFFSNQFFERMQFHSSTPYTPIFIVGMPRSGSTLLDQILSAHSAVYSGGESSAMEDTIGEIEDDTNNKIGYPAYLNEFDQRKIEKYSSSYIEKITQGANTATHIVDKNLFNFMNLGLIALLFPNAKIIHAKRHPLDTALSCYMTSFNVGLKWTNDLEHIAKYYLGYRKLMDHWYKTLPIPILDMQYEDVVGDSEKSVRRLLKFCGLEWEDACLEFYKSKRSVNTASITQVRQPMYKSSVQRWVPYAKELQPVILALGDLLESDYDKIESLGLKHGMQHNNPLNKISKLFK